MKYHVAALATPVPLAKRHSVHVQLLTTTVSGGMNVGDWERLEEARQCDWTLAL